MSGKKLSIEELILLNKQIPIYETAKSVAEYYKSVNDIENLEKWYTKMLHHIYAKEFMSMGRMPVDEFINGVLYDIYIYYACKYRDSKDYWKSLNYVYRITFGKPHDEVQHVILWGIEQTCYSNLARENPQEIIPEPFVISELFELIDVYKNFYGNKEKKENAIKKIEDAYSKYPNNPIVIFAKVDLLRNQKKYEEVLPLLKNCVENYPNVSIINIRYIRSLVSNKFFDEAEKYVQHVINLEPDNYENYEKIEMIYTKEDPNKIRDRIIPKMVELSPNHYNLLFKYSKILVDQGDYDKAEEYANRMIDMILRRTSYIPKNSARYQWLSTQILEYLNFRGELFIKMKKYDEALQDINTLKKLFRTQKSTFLEAKMFHNQGEFKKAKKLYNLIIKSNGDVFNQTVEPFLKKIQKKELPY